MNGNNSKERIMASLRGGPAEEREWMKKMEGLIDGRGQHWGWRRGWGRGSSDIETA